MTAQEKYEEIGVAMEQSEGSVIGQMFGKPCLKFQNKAFAAFQDDGMIFRLGAEDIKDTKEIYLGSVNWDPGKKGRAMKDWLWVPFEFEHDWNKLALQSLEHLKSIL